MTVAEAVEVKERPILFSGEMVLAILSGRKTQTRRVAKILDNVRVEDGMAKGYLPGCPEGFDVACPYGKRGDRLWVRETFGIPDAPYSEEVKALVAYRADQGAQLAELNKYFWRPSIFMPRWASRLTLEIEQVRVQRIQEISSEDAIAEGAWRSNNPALESVQPPEF